MTCVSTLLSYLGGSCYVFVAIYEVIYHSGGERINLKETKLYQYDFQKFTREILA